MTEDEMLLMLRRWYQQRRDAYGIPEGQEIATTAEKQALKDWLHEYGLNAVNSAMWDVILKGRKVEGYHPRLRHVGQVLQRDYHPKDQQPATTSNNKYIGGGSRDDVLTATWAVGHSKEGTE